MNRLVYRYMVRFVRLSKDLTLDFLAGFNLPWPDCCECDEPATVRDAKYQEVLCEQHYELRRMRDEHGHE